MSETPNHGYNVPTEGEQNWHEPLNENFEQYDTDIEIRDEEDNRADYDPKAGAKFLATDTGKVYIGDGATWDEAFDLSEAGVESVYGVEPDGNGNVDLESWDGSVEFEGDAAGNAVDVGVADEQSFSRVDAADGFLGINRSDPVTGNTVFTVGSPAGSDEYGGMYVDTEASSGWPFYGYASNGSARAWHYWDGTNAEWKLVVNDTDSLIVDQDGQVGVGDVPAGSRLEITEKPDDVRALLVDGSANVQSDLQVVGDLDVTGNKNFVQTVDTDDGERDVVYTATEAGTPHTEASGVATLEDGRAEVDLPEHFAWVTSDADPLHVQTTPHAVDSGGLAVVERSRERIVVADRDGDGDYEFSYTVKGTRDGHADKDVVREPSANEAAGTSPAPGDD